MRGASGLLVEGRADGNQKAPEAQIGNERAMMSRQRESAAKVERVFPFAIQSRWVMQRISA